MDIEPINTPLERLEPNASLLIDCNLTFVKPLEWIEQNTALLIIHGVGNQNPLETLDSFATTLIQMYTEGLGDSVPLKLEHKIAVKNDPATGTWFDNFIRISKANSNFHLDLFEYYWAYQTQDKATPVVVQRWISGVVKQANKFYEENVALTDAFNSRKYFKRRLLKNDKGDTYTFRHLKYKFLLFTVGQLIPFGNWLLKKIKWFIDKIPLIKHIPFLKGLVSKIINWLDEKYKNTLVNIAGDLVIYNTADAKSNFFYIRKKILEGSVNALRFLIEPQFLMNENGKVNKEKKERMYGKVILAGHSLGSQIAFDTINRITHLIKLNQIEGLNEDGSLIDADSQHPHLKKASDLLSGLITFGSPLDKIAFFFREQVAAERILMLQLIHDYHCFRQRPWYTALLHVPENMRMETPFTCLFEDIVWRNYFDRKDPISGSLDFYRKVINVDCNLNEGIGRFRRFFSMTHSKYWKRKAMFKDIIQNYL